VETPAKTGIFVVVQAPPTPHLTCDDTGDESFLDEEPWPVGVRVADGDTWEDISGEVCMQDKDRLTLPERDQHLSPSVTPCENANETGTLEGVVDPALAEWNLQWGCWMDGEGPAPKALHLVGQNEEQEKMADGQLTV